MPLAAGEQGLSAAVVERQHAGKDDVRAFTCGFVVRSFDVDERDANHPRDRRFAHGVFLPLDLGKRVLECSRAASLMASRARCVMAVVSA